MSRLIAERDRLLKLKQQKEFELASVLQQLKELNQQISTQGNKPR